MDDVFETGKTAAYSYKRLIEHGNAPDDIWFYCRLVTGLPHDEAYFDRMRTYFSYRMDNPILRLSPFPEMLSLESILQDISGH